MPIRRKSLTVLVAGLLLGCSEASIVPEAPPARPRTEIHRADIPLPCEPETIVRTRSLHSHVESAISNDGRWVVARPFPTPWQTVQLFDLENQQRRAIQFNPEDPVAYQYSWLPISPVISPNNDTIAMIFTTVSERVASRILLIDLNTHEATVIGDGVEYFQHLEFSTDGRYLFYVGGVNDHIYNSDPSLEKRTTGARGLFTYELETGQRYSLANVEYPAGSFECVVDEVTVPLGWGFIRRIVALDNGNIAAMLGNPFLPICGPNGHLFVGLPRRDNRDDYLGWREIPMRSDSEGRLALDFSASEYIAEEIDMSRITPSGVQLFSSARGTYESSRSDQVLLQETPGWQFFRQVGSGLFYSTDHSIIGTLNFQDDNELVLLEWDYLFESNPEARARRIDLSTFEHLEPICVR